MYRRPIDDNNPPIVDIKIKGGKKYYKKITEKRKRQWCPKEEMIFNSFEISGSDLIMKNYKLGKQADLGTEYAWEEDLYYLFRIFAGFGMGYKKVKVVCKNTTRVSYNYGTGKDMYLNAGQVIYNKRIFLYNNNVMENLNYIY